MLVIPSIINHSEVEFYILTKYQYTALIMEKGEGEEMEERMRQNDRTIMTKILYVWFGLIKPLWKLVYATNS